MDITDGVVSWFKSSLCNRTQRANYLNKLSEHANITSCITGQRFRACPVLIFISDFLGHLLDGSYLAYADDVTLVSTGHTLSAATDAVQKLVDCVLTWLNNNYLCLNTEMLCYTN